MANDDKRAPTCSLLNFFQLKEFVGFSYTPVWNLLSPKKTLNILLLKQK